MRHNPILSPRGIPRYLIYTHVVSLGSFADGVDDVGVLAVRVPGERVEDVDVCRVGGGVVDELGEFSCQGVSTKFVIFGCILWLAYSR